MTKKNTTRKALLSSVLALVLCFSMLLGTTFAWFTDSVTSANNIIKSGDLEISMDWAKGTDALDSASWNDASTSAIFNNSLWEPGFVDAKHIKITNKGTLALKYQLFIEPNGTVEELADVIDVYVIKDGKQLADRAELAGLTPVGTLSEVIDSFETLVYGQITENEEYDIFTIALKMRESAGNEYENKQIGASFALKLLATQLAYEGDSFDEKYDEDAVYPGKSDASALGDEDIVLSTVGDNTSTITLPAQLVNAIDDGTVTDVSINSSLPSVQTDASGNVSVVYNTFEIVDQNGKEIDLSDNTVAISVKLYVGTAYAGKYATVAHDGVMLANAIVDANGYVSYNTTHFCEISVALSDNAPESGMEDVKNEEAEDLTKLVQVLVGKHYYTVSQGMANSWKTLSNAEQIVADIYVPEDLIAYAMMYNNGDITANTGVHSDLTLKNDLDFATYNWVSIGRFYTNIHGENKTVSNLNDSFLGCVYDCQIENLTLENVTVSGSASGVVAKELAGDIFITNLTVAGKNTVSYVKDNATNWPEEGTGVGAICGISLIGCGGQGNVEINVTGSIEVNYNDVFFGNNTNLENLGVTKEFGLNVFKANANATVTVAEGGSITTNGQGYWFDVADLEDGFAVDKLSGNYYVFSAAGLSAFAAEVNDGNNFKGKTVVLYNDVDLENKNWTPIGNSSISFQGTFDGNEKTVKNLTVNMPGKSNVGLFGMTTNGAVKNLTVENASIVGRLNVGVVAGTPYTSKYSNITVKGHVEVSGMSYVGAVGGKNAYANWDNITVDVDETSYVKANSVENGVAYRTYVGGVIGFMGEGGHKVSNVTSNIDVIGSTCDVGGIVGIAHYGNTFENILCTGDVTITDAAEAGDAEEMGGIAGVWMNNTSNVTFNNCKFKGTLTANITEGVDLSNNTITGKGYGSTTSNKLIIDGKEVVVLVLPETYEGGEDALDVLDELLNGEEENYVSLESDVEGSADASNAYGSTGINIKNGDTIDGNGKTFSVQNCGGKWDSAINITGGTIKNLTIDSGFRGVFVNHNSENSGKVYLENVIIDGPTYTISCDQGTGNGLEATNSTFNGWTSYAATIGDVKFVDCSFGEGAGYAYCRPYAPTEFVGCDFAEGFRIDARAKVTFENCTINGVPLTAENLATLVISNIQNASVK